MSLEVPQGARLGDSHSTFPFMSSSISGIFTPHFKSLVTEEGFSPALNLGSTIFPRELTTGFWDQAPDFQLSLIHVSSLGCTESNLMYMCQEGREVTLCVGETWHRGSVRSTGSSVREQLSHWSPRASSYKQYGHVPSTNRSARNLNAIKLT